MFVYVYEVIMKYVCWIKRDPDPETLVDASSQCYCELM